EAVTPRQSLSFASKPPRGELSERSTRSTPSSPPRFSRELAAWVEHALLDNLVCPQQDGLRDRQAQRLGGLAVDDQFELGGLLGVELGGLRTLGDFVHVKGGTTKEMFEMGAKAHEPARLHMIPKREECRQSVFEGQVGDSLSRGYVGAEAKHEHGLHVVARHY